MYCERSASCVNEPTARGRCLCGFTLVELVLVIIIIGIVSAIALPRFAQANARQQLDAAARRVANDLEKAQHLARASSNWVTLSFDTAENSYTFASVSNDVLEVQLAESPYQVKLTKAAFNDAPLVVFNGFGVPNAGGTITLKSSAGFAVITLDTSGSVSR